MFCSFINQCRLRWNRLTWRQEPNEPAMLTKSDEGLAYESWFQGVYYWTRTSEVICATQNNGYGVRAFDNALRTTLCTWNVNERRWYQAPIHTKRTRHPADRIVHKCGWIWIYCKSILPPTRRLGLISLMVSIAIKTRRKFHIICAFRYKDSCKMLYMVQ